MSVCVQKLIAWTLHYNFILSLFGFFYIFYIKALLGYIHISKDIIKVLILQSNGGKCTCFDDQWGTPGESTQSYTALQHRGQPTGANPRFENASNTVKSRGTINKESWHTRRSMGKGILKVKNQGPSRERPTWMSRMGGGNDRWIQSQLPRRTEWPSL
jgi:hypothetical protein